MSTGRGGRQGWRWRLTPASSPPVCSDSGKPEISSHWTPEEEPSEAAVPEAGNPPDWCHVTVVTQVTLACDGNSTFMPLSISTATSFSMPTSWAERLSSCFLTWWTFLRTNHNLPFIAVAGQPATPTTLWVSPQPLLALWDEEAVLHGTFLSEQRTSFASVKDQLLPVNKVHVNDTWTPPVPRRRALGLTDSTFIWLLLQILLPHTVWDFSIVMPSENLFICGLTGLIPTVIFSPLLFVVHKNSKSIHLLTTSVWQGRWV